MIKKQNKKISKTKGTLILVSALFLMILFFKNTYDVIQIGIDAQKKIDYTIDHEENKMKTDDIINSSVHSKQYTLENGEIEIITKGKTKNGTKKEVRIIVDFKGDKKTKKEYENGVLKQEYIWDKKKWKEKS